VRNRERREEQHEDEEVVDRERRVGAGLASAARLLLAAERAADPDAEREREGDVEDGPSGGLLHRHGVRAPGDEEVDDEQQHHAGDGGRPDQRGADRVTGGERVDRGGGHGRDGLDHGVSSGHVCRS